MKDETESLSRPNGPLSVVLRLGCALLACAGIAAARTPVGAGDDAASRLRAPEQAVGPVLETAQERDAALASPAGPSLRPSRRAAFHSRGSVPAAAARDAGRGGCPSVPAVPSAVSVPASVRAPGAASPRAPPASA